MIPGLDDVAIFAARIRQEGATDRLRPAWHLFICHLFIRRGCWWRAAAIASLGCGG